jgi:hypothetical protein
MESAVIRLGGKKGGYVLVDAEDFERLSQHTWWLNNSESGYVVTSIKLGVNRRMLVFLHRAVMEPIAIGEMVDHVNGNKLDCRKSNLRACTTTENNRNRGPAITKRSSQYKNVFPRGKSGGFYARVEANLKRHSSKRFETEEEAAHWADAKMLEIHGPFAKLNFPMS